MERSPTSTTTADLVEELAPDDDPVSDWNEERAEEERNRQGEEADQATADSILEELDRREE